MSRSQPTSPEARLAGFKSLLTRIAITLLLAVGVAVLAAGGLILTREAGRVAVVWLANGFAVAFILRRAAAERTVLLASAGTGILLANVLLGDSLFTAFVLASCNVVEMFLVVRFMTPVMGVAEPFAGQAIARFLGVAAAAPLLSAGLAAAFLSATHGGIAASDFLSWYIADALGLVIVAPLLLSIDRRAAETKTAQGYLESPLIQVLAAAATAFVFTTNNAPLLFTITPIMLLAAFRLRMFAAAMTLFAISTIAISLTVLGSGPIAHAALSTPARSFLLQGFIATLVVLVLPVRAVIGERDRLGAAYRTSERLFQRIAEASSAGLLYLDMMAKVTFANRRWHLLTAFTPMDLDGPSWLDVIDSRDRAEAERLWAKTRALHEPTSAELRYHNPDTGPGWAELSFNPELVDDRVRGYVVRLADISDRRAAEQALQSSEELYRLLAENSQDVIARFDLDGRTLYMSNAAQRLFGYDPGALIGQNFARFVQADDIAAFQSLFAAARVGHGEMSAPYRVRRQLGDDVWVETTARLVSDPATGAPRELIASIRDVDARRRSENVAAEAAASVRESNRLLTLAESLAHIGHWRFDISSRRLACSSQIKVMLNLTHAMSHEPREIVERFHPDDQRTLLRSLARARRDRSVIECRARLLTDEGGPRHLRLITHGERDTSGAVTGLFGVVRDVTDEVISQAELIRARDSAEAATRAKSEFVATMSHEIRTPMTGVLGMIDLLRSTANKPDRERYLATLKQSADLLMTVLDDVLDFSRIESGKIEFEECDFDLGALVQSTLNLFDGAASQKGLLLSAQQGAPGAAVVRGDPVRLQQIICNLVSNAIKFTPAGRITVLLSDQLPADDRALTRWRLEVRDTGVGLSPEQLDRLFEPFVQAEANIARRFGGTGLGLAISRRLIEAMGGQMGVNSRLGRGSTFWFELDMATGTLAAPIVKADRLLSRRSLDVLVAEDNPVNQMLIGALLQRFGHTATCVENGRLAVEIAAVRRFDCILMDMQMPEMDGLAATRAIRASPGPNAAVPIIALTADASSERRRFYDNVGLTDFLTKPIDRKALGDRLAAIADALPANATATAPVAEAAIPIYLPEELVGPPISDVEEALSAARYDELREALGGAQARALLELLVVELDRRPGRIRELIERGDLVGARAEAHSLCGAARNVGAVALGRVAAAIEEADDEQDVGDELDALDRQTRRTVKAIAALG